MACTTLWCFSVTDRAPGRLPFRDSFAPVADKVPRGPGGLTTRRHSDVVSMDDIGPLIIACVYRLVTGLESEAFCHRKARSPRGTRNSIEILLFQIAPAADPWSSRVPRFCFSSVSRLAFL